jgi:TetR/AcrR family transcriptional repressor of nem operon
MPRTKQFKEEEVLQKAIELFWKQGFHATSMDKLVKTLGISRASLYDTFGSKKQLFLKAFQLYRQQNNQLINQFLSEQPTVKEGIYNLFLHAISDTLQDKENKGCFVVNCTTELLPNDQDLLMVLSENRKGFIDFFKDYLQQGVDNGEISKEKDLDGLAGFLFTLYSGLKVIGKTQPSASELKAYISAGLVALNS